MEVTYELAEKDWDFDYLRSWYTVSLQITQSSQLSAGANYNVVHPLQHACVLPAPSILLGKLTACT
jgi:hypothetical protein